MVEAIASTSDDLEVDGGRACSRPAIDSAIHARANTKCNIPYDLVRFGLSLTRRAAGPADKFAMPSALAGADRARLRRLPP